MNNTKTIQEIYEAFGRGDIPAIMEKLSDSIEWDYSGNTADVPWFKKRRGKEEVAGFFESLNELQFNKFEPKDFLEGKNIVVSILDIDLIVKSNGNRIIEEDAAHIWRFDSEGKIVSFRHGVDTYQHHSAYNSSAKTSEAVS